MADWNKQIHEGVSQAEVEIKKAIAYLNDEVVPAIRKEGGDALKAAAEQLRTLAEKLEKKR